jgi:hypothetical protein
VVGERSSTRIRRPRGPHRRRAPQAELQSPGYEYERVAAGTRGRPDAGEPLRRAADHAVVLGDFDADARRCPACCSGAVEARWMESASATRTPGRPSGRTMPVWTFSGENPARPRRRVATAVSRRIDYVLYAAARHADPADPVVRTHPGPPRDASGPATTSAWWRTSSCRSTRLAHGALVLTALPRSAVRRRPERAALTPRVIAALPQPWHRGGMPGRAAQGLSRGEPVSHADDVVDLCLREPTGSLVASRMSTATATRQRTGAGGTAAAGVAAAPPALAARARRAGRDVDAAPVLRRDRRSTPSRRWSCGSPRPGGPRCAT